MSQNLRSLAERLGKTVKSFSGAPQRQAKLPLNVSIETAKQTGNLQINNAKPLLSVAGFSHELSKTNVSFVLPFIRLGEHYLAGHGGEQKRLKLILELPNGTIRLTVLTQRYQMIEIHDSVQQYLINAQIAEMNEGDREVYDEFIRRGMKAVSVDSTEESVAEKKGSLLGYLHSIF